MLDKLKVTMLVGVALQLLRSFLPDLETPENLEAHVNALVDALFAIVPVLAGWLTKESPKNVKGLKLKGA